MKSIKSESETFIEYRNIDGLYHREDGPALEYKDGCFKVWYINGNTHRDGGPAKIWSNGDKEWFQHGKVHREDGPALEYPGRFNQWWIKGKHIPVNSQEEFERYLRLIIFQ